MDEEKHEPRILLVDDDEAVRRDYTKVLRRLGFVIDAYSGHRDHSDRCIVIGAKRRWLSSGLFVGFLLLLVGFGISSGWTL
jgi:hypothetical protein